MGLGREEKKFQTHNVNMISLIKRRFVNLNVQTEYVNKSNE